MKPRPRDTPARGSIRDDETLLYAEAARRLGLCSKSRAQRFAGLRVVQFGRWQYTTGRWVRAFVEGLAEQQAGNAQQAERQPGWRRRAASMKATASKTAKLPAPWRRITGRRRCPACKGRGCLVTGDPAVAAVCFHVESGKPIGAGWLHVLDDRGPTSAPWRLALPALRRLLAAQKGGPL